MTKTAITLQGKGVEQMDGIDIQISIQATVNVNAQTAQRRVTKWLVSEVGNMLVGGTPQLVISRETVWRVPVILTSSQVGEVDEVGSVDVNAESGDLLLDDALRDQILGSVADVNYPTLPTIS